MEEETSSRQDDAVEKERARIAHVLCRTYGLSFEEAMEVIKE